MRRALLLAVLVVAQAAIEGQALVAITIRVVLADAAGRATPVARHALLISDNPPTREPRRVVTNVDGTAVVRLRPGNYTIESDQPVAFQGQAYHWRQVLDLARETSLDLTLSNAVAEPIAAATNGDTPLATDTSLMLRQWLDSVVQLWTPTTHASGFLVDAAGLIATSQKVVGDATSVEVQLSRTVKVTGSVLETDRQRDIAIIRIDPDVMAGITPVPLGCGRSAPISIAREQELFTVAAPLRQQRGWTPGSVSDTRANNLEMNLATGGLGGPVFTASGDLVGLTTLVGEREEPRRGVVRMARTDGMCDVVAAAARKAKDGAGPSAARLPVEPVEPAPVATFKEAVKRRAGSLKPYQTTASDFEVAFITPILNFAAQSQPTVTFSNWSEYVADIPPVLFIRVTPKAVESLWAKAARGAAMTQGMALPAMKRLKSGFGRMQVLCGSTDVTPIHPFRLELPVSETETIDEGFYAFDPASLGPSCGTVTLVLYSEKEPAKADTRVVDRAVLQQVWRDFGFDASR